jgi:hypothetical protein
MAMSSKLWIAIAGCAALTACNTVHKNIATEDPLLGEAVAYDNALQIINPDPVYAENGAKPGDNGDKAARAMKAYRQGQVLQKHNSESRQGSAISTTSGNTGGGSGPQ